ARAALHRSRPPPCAARAPVSLAHVPCRRSPPRPLPPLTTKHVTTIDVTTADVTNIDDSNSPVTCHEHSRQRRPRGAPDFGSGPGPAHHSGTRTITSLPAPSDSDSHIGAIVITPTAGLHSLRCTQRPDTERVLLQELRQSGLTLGQARKYHRIPITGQHDLVHISGHGMDIYIVIRNGPAVERPVPPLVTSQLIAKDSLQLKKREDHLSARITAHQVKYFGACRNICRYHGSPHTFGKIIH